MNAPSDPDRPREERRDPDPLAAYADGDPDAVRAAAPREPSDAQWEATRRRIHTRLSGSPANTRRPWRAAIWLASGAAVAGTVAAAVAWVMFGTNLLRDNPRAPEVAETRPGPTPVAPAPREAQPDPLADFAVLPMASDDDIVFHRVPGGDGWFPVGAHPLAGVLSLATADDVALNDPDEVWPQVILSPGDVPMIFATKPR